MRNDLTIYDSAADGWWSDDIGWVRTLKNLVPGRLSWFDARIDWRGKTVLDLGCAGEFMAEALALRGAKGHGHRSCRRRSRRGSATCANSRVWHYIRRWGG